jgi:hypothetical protein
MKGRCKMRGLIAVIIMSLLFWLVVLWAGMDAAKVYKQYLDKQDKTIQSIYERGTK